jgi:ABC-type dipeptide/oligopeptide/nickel transport system permease subunit
MTTEHDEVLPAGARAAEEYSHDIVAHELHDLESVGGDETAHTGLTHRGRATRVVRFKGLLRELWHDKAGLFGVCFLLLLVFVAVFAPLLAPHDPHEQNLTERLLPPFWGDGGSWTYPLGTDGLGRDVLSRLMYGARISLFVGVAVVAIAGTVGVVMGLLAGYRGGRTDRIVMRTVDTQIAFPGLLIAILLASLIGPSVRTVIIVLAINGWMIYARMARGVVLSVKETAYVEAAEIIGCRPKRVMFKHILPNLAAPLSTLAVLEFARIVLAEAALSYLGVGVKRTDISWGLDVANGQDFIFNSWWLVVMPGIAISLTVLSVNLVASWLRIISDPAEREKRFAATQKLAKLAKKLQRQDVSAARETSRA